MELRNFRNRKNISFIQMVSGISDLKAAEDIKIFESLQNSVTVADANYQLNGNVCSVTVEEHIKMEQTISSQLFFREKTRSKIHSVLSHHGRWHIFQKPQVFHTCMVFQIQDSILSWHAYNHFFLSWSEIYFPDFCFWPLFFKGNWSFLIW